MVQYQNLSPMHYGGGSPKPVGMCDRGCGVLWDKTELQGSGMGSFRDLHEEIKRGDEDLANILSMAKALTNDLESLEFDGWIDSELNGYADPQQVPDYRRFRAEIAESAKTGLWQVGI